MSSRVGYGKSGTFEVYAGYGNNTLSYFIGGVSGEYRNLKFLKPVTGELKTWLDANAVKMPLEGTWVFNATPNLPSSEIDISPISSSTDISVLEPEYDTANGPLLLTGINVSESSIGFYTYLDGDEHLYQAYGNGAWEDNSMRAITFTEPVQYEGNEEFIRWFVDNAVQIGVGVTAYKLNKSITCSTTRSLSGTSSNSANLYAYNCTPYFTEIPTGSKILLSNGNLDDLTGIIVTGQQKITLKTISNKKYLDPSLTMSMHYSKDVTVGNSTSFLIGNAETFSNGMTMQGLGKVYCPSSMTYTTNNEILLFSTAPTGDLLTWLNTNTTKI